MTTASFNSLGTRGAGAGVTGSAGARLAKAFELWKFDSLSDPGSARNARQSAAPPPDPAAALNQVRESAKADGYQAGLIAGRTEGLRLAAEESARLCAVLDGVEVAVTSLQDEVGVAVLALAFDVARQVLRTELATEPESMLPAIREALDLASSSGQPGAQAQLMLCPADAALVRAHLHDLLQAGQWRVVEDNTIASGGCRIVTGSGAIDATVATRWQRVSQALGRADAW